MQPVNISMFCFYAVSQCTAFSAHILRTATNGPTMTWMS
uniref:Uncharacterized protein n=1 Tax=Anguilla anguilla TaxID=7936 RepID=A0A0E9U2A2_ANGAN